MTSSRWLESERGEGMPSVLAIVPGTMLPRRVSLKNATIDVHTMVSRALQDADRRTYDLLVLGPMPADRQSATVRQLQVRRRWRSIPVLYLAAHEALGIVIPEAYRPEIDSVARGTLESADVQRKILELLRGAAGGANPVMVGPYELDPGRRRLRFHDGEVSLTPREAELLAVLMSRPNETVPAGQLLKEGWSVEFDPQTVQTLRRHVSNLRQKLDRAAVGTLVRTVRGQGYRFVARRTS